MSEGLPLHVALGIATLLGVPGLVMVIVGIVLVVVARRKFAACTAVTTGFVEDYRLFGGQDCDAIAPLVSYQVDGRAYEVLRKFRSVSSVTVSAPWLPRAEAELWVTPDDTLHVRAKGSSINYGAPASRLWPLGSPMPVYYNPAKPWQAYAQVKRVGGAAAAGWGLIIAGALLLAGAPVLLYFLTTL